MVKKRKKTKRQRVVRDLTTRKAGFLKVKGGKVQFQDFHFN